MSYYIPTFADYDKALIERLKLIKVQDPETGALKPINALYYMPEPEGNLDVDIQRPAIVFYLYDMAPDVQREHSIMSYVVSQDSFDITTKQVPSPIKFFYQFTILTDYKEHESSIIQQFNKLFPMRGHLTITEPTGEKTSYDFFQKQFMSMDSHLQVPNGGTTNKRIFRKIYRYHLYTEIDEFTEFTYKKVQGVHPKVYPKK